MPPDRLGTLLVVLGASSFPDAGLAGSDAFKSAANSIVEYFLSETGLGVPSSNLLDLFDSTLGPDRLDKKLGEWLSHRARALQSDGIQPSDLFVYYVGHGSFDERRRYYLALRTTRQQNKSVSSLKVDNLLITLDHHASSMRRFAVIDACFAGEFAFSQSNVEDAMAQQLAVLPMRGTCALCSSARDSISEFLEDHSNTKFTKALCESLWDGDSTLESSHLSLAQIRALAESRLSLEPAFIRPEIHNPMQAMGQLDSLPIFPNGPRRRVAEDAAKATQNRIMLLAEVEARRVEQLRLDQESETSASLHEAEIQRTRHEQIESLRGRLVAITYDFEEERLLRTAAESGDETAPNTAILAKWLRYSRDRRNEKMLVQIALAARYDAEGKSREEEWRGWSEQATKQLKDGYTPEGDQARRRSFQEFDRWKDCEAKARCARDSSEDERLSLEFFEAFARDEDRINQVASACGKRRVSFAEAVQSQLQGILAHSHKRRHRRRLIANAVKWVKRTFWTLVIVSLIGFCTYVGEKH